MRQTVQLKVYHLYLNYAQFLSSLNGKSVAEVIENACDEAFNNNPDGEVDALIDYCFNYIKKQISTLI